MSRRSIEIVVGKLIVDRGFRRTFLQWPHRSLIQLSTTGVVLSDLEVSALVATDRALWSRLAECVDPRLQVDEAADANESADELAAHRSSALRLQTERVEHRIGDDVRGGPRRPTAVHGAARCIREVVLGEPDT